MSWLAKNQRGRLMDKNEVFRDSAESAYAEVQRLTAENEVLRAKQGAARSRRLKMFLRVGSACLVIAVASASWWFWPKSKPESRLESTSTEEGCVFDCTLGPNPSNEELEQNFDCKNRQLDWKRNSGTEYLRRYYDPPRCRSEGGTWYWGRR